MSKTQIPAIPASLAQETFYQEHRPNYLNYAALGTLIGHELTVALMNSEAEPKFCWTPQTMKVFKNKTSCLLDEYQNSEEDTVNLMNL